jgi:hypothetical protein
VAFTNLQNTQRRLGVNMGGTHGRPGLLHMGISTNRGGLNTQGSAPKPNLKPRFPVARPVPRPAGARPRERPGMKPAPRPATKPVVHAATPGVDAPPVGPHATPEIPRNPLDYRSQSSYIAAMGGLNYDLDGQRRDLQSTLAANKLAYDREMGDSRRAAQDSVVRDSASLAARGLSSSGMREDTDADRFREFDRHMADVEQQYGSGATAQINAALARLSEYEALQRQGIENRARDEWGELYPAAPIGGPDEGGPAAGPAATAPAPVRRPAAPAPRPVSGGIGAAPPPGTPAPVPVSKMTMQQAINQFRGARTYQQGGNTVRTSAWTNFLRQNGLL